MRYLIKDFKEGQFFKDNITGIIWKVLCNDWWENGVLRDFIVIDKEGRKKHLTFIKSEAYFKDVDFVESFGECESDLLKKENRRFREALKKIAYTPTFERLCDVEVYAAKVLEGDYEN